MARISSTERAPALFARSTARALSCLVKPSPMSADTASSSCSVGSAETFPPTFSPPSSSSAEILPCSSRIMRSAVFLPLGIRCGDGFGNIGRAHGRKKGNRHFRPHALHGRELEKEPLFLHIGKSEQRNAILFYLQIGINFALARARKLGKRRARTYDFISYAVHFQKHEIGRKIFYLSFEITYHKNHQILRSRKFFASKFCELFLPHAARRVPLRCGTLFAAYLRLLVRQGDQAGAGTSDFKQTSRPLTEILFCEKNFVNYRIPNKFANLLVKA